MPTDRGRLMTGGAAAIGVAGAAAVVRWLMGKSTFSIAGWLWAVTKWSSWLLLALTCGAFGYCWGVSRNPKRKITGTSEGHAGGKLEGETAAAWFTGIMQALWPGVQKHVRTQIIEAWMEPMLKAKLGPNVYFDNKELGDAYPQMGPVTTRKTKGDRPHRPGGKGEGLEWRIGMSYFSNCNFRLVMGPGIMVGLRNLKVKGTLLVKLRPLQDEMPFIGGMEMTFLEPPDISLEFQGVGAVVNLPGLESTVMGAINGGVAGSMVLPNRMGFKIDWTGSVDMCKVRAPEPMGILSITVLEGKNLVASDIAFFSAATSDPFVQITVGTQQQQTTTKMATLNPSWRDEKDQSNTLDFRIDSKEQVVDIKVYDWDRMKPADLIGVPKVGKLTADDLLDWGGENEIEVELVFEDGSPGGSIVLQAKWLTLRDLRGLSTLRHAGTAAFSASPPSSPRESSIVFNDDEPPSPNKMMSGLTGLSGPTDGPGRSPRSREIMSILTRGVGLKHSAILAVRLERVEGHRERVDQSYHFKATVATDSNPAHELRDSWWGWAPYDGVPNDVARRVQKAIEELVVPERKRGQSGGSKSPESVSQATPTDVSPHAGRRRASVWARLADQETDQERIFNSVCRDLPYPISYSLVKEYLQVPGGVLDIQRRARNLGQTKDDSPEGRKKRYKAGKQATAAKAQWDAKVNQQRAARRKTAEPQFEQTMYFLLPPDWKGVTLTLCDQDMKPESSLVFTRATESGGCLSLGTEDFPSDSAEFCTDGTYEYISYEDGKESGRGFREIGRGGLVKGPFELQLPEYTRPDYTPCFLHGSVQVSALVPRRFLKPELEESPLYPFFKGLEKETAESYVTMFREQGIMPINLKQNTRAALQELLLLSKTPAGITAFGEDPMRSRFRRVGVEENHVDLILRNTALVNLRDAAGLRRRAVTVIVRAGYGLIVQDALSSDPYVTVEYEGEKKETPSVYQNLNPVWEDGNRFTFPLHSAVSEVTLVVRDQDWGGASQFMGRVAFRPLAARFRGGVPVVLPLGIDEHDTHEQFVLKTRGWTDDARKARPLGSVEVCVQVEDGGDASLVEGAESMLSLFKLNELFLHMDKTGDNCVTREELIDVLKEGTVVEKTLGRGATTTKKSAPKKTKGWFTASPGGSGPASAAASGYQTPTGRGSENTPSRRGVRKLKGFAPKPEAPAK
eukprot:Hpha_TRINITY_DN16867_c1_g1::TRINITY_DN16867_c1_g1_i1::g.149120::m.149120